MLNNKAKKFSLKVGKKDMQLMIGEERQEN